MKNTLILLSLFLLPLSVSAQVNCGKIAWTQEGRMENGLFVGELAGECTVKPGRPGNMDRLRDQFEREMLKDVITKFEADVPDDSLGIPGNRFDLLLRSPDGKIRNQIIIASTANQFFYDIQSKEINFSGMAGYLRKLAVRTEIKKIADGNYLLKLKCLNKIQKPGLATAGIFLPIARKTSLEQFEKRLNEAGKTAFEGL